MQVGFKGKVGDLQLLIYWFGPGTSTFILVLVLVLVLVLIRTLKMPEKVIFVLSFSSN